MSTKICRYCGSSQLYTKEIEIRSINASTMKVKSSEYFTELECQACGWIGSQDTLMLAGAF